MDAGNLPSITGPRETGALGTTPGAGITALPATAGSFMNGTDGTVNMTWARYQLPPPQYGYWNPGNAGGGRYAREATTAAAVAGDLEHSNPVLSTIVDNLELFAAGTGLTLSSKPDLARYGVSREAIRALSHTIETRFAAWAKNPREVDFTGRFNLHMLASCAFRTYLITGEVVATLDYKTIPGCRTRTKVALLAPAQLDHTKTLQTETLRTIAGVAFNNQGRVFGYWLRNAPMGDMIGNPMPELVPAYTSWGRPKVIHLFQQKDPRQVRGMTPLTPSLTPAHSRETLGEFTLASAYLQTQFSLTVESDLPTATALQGLQINHAEGGMADWVKGRSDWYTQAKVTVKPGVVNHLAPGDKLKFNRSETPNSTFDSFDKSLTRRAARAAGSSYEDVSGDYSQTSFSASRWANEAPHRMTMKRRTEIISPLYQAVFRAWLEEEIAFKRIEIPDDAPSFWEDPDAYTNAKWLGAPRSEPDRNKHALAQQHELENGLLTLTDALAERGIDFESQLETLQNEREQLEAIGLKHPFWSEKVRAQQQPIIVENNQ